MERTLNSPIAPGRFRRVSQPPVQTEVSYDRSALSRVWAALRANRLAMVCLVLMIIIIAASALAFLSPYDPRPVRRPGVPDRGLLLHAGVGGPGHRGGHGQRLCGRRG